MSSFYIDESEYEYEEYIEEACSHYASDDECEDYNFYYNTVKTLPKLKRKEELQLYQKMIKGDTSAREELIVSQLRMVIDVAKHYINRGISFDDLVQEGNLAMISAIDTYNYKPSLGIAAYARQVVHNHLAKYIEDTSPIVRIPAYMYDDVSKINKAKSQLQNTLFRYPTYQDIANNLHMSLEEVKKIHYYAADYLAEDISGFKDEYFPYIADSESVAIVDSAFRRELQIKLFTAMDYLTPREAKIIYLRFGFEDGRARTLEEIGKELDITRERIRQIEAKALRKLRHTRNARLLKGYINYAGMQEPYVYPLEGLETLGVTWISQIRNHNIESQQKNDVDCIKVDIPPPPATKTNARLSIETIRDDDYDYMHTSHLKRRGIPMDSHDDLEYELYSNYPYKVEFTRFYKKDASLRFWVMNHSHQPIKVALLELKVDGQLTRYFNILGEVEPHKGHFFDITTNSPVRTGKQHIKAVIEINNEYYDALCESKELSLRVDWDTSTIST